MPLLSERTQPVLMANTVAGTSYAATGSLVVDMQTYQADSLFIVATVNATTLLGFTMTAQGSASSGSGFGGYCTAAGSTTSLLTAATTAPAKICTIDIKNAPHRFVRVSHTGLAATNVTILGFPYDSKKQAVTANTGDVASAITSVAPTTA